MLVYREYALLLAGRGGELLIVCVRRSLNKHPPHLVARVAGFKRKRERVCMLSSLRRVQLSDIPVRELHQQQAIIDVI